MKGRLQQAPIGVHQICQPLIFPGEITHFFWAGRPEPATHICPESIITGDNKNEGRLSPSPHRSQSPTMDRGFTKKLGTPVQPGSDPGVPHTTSPMRLGERMSIKDKPGVNPRHTEAVALETNLGLMQECSELMRALHAACMPVPSQSPQAWSLAAQKFDEAADNCRMAEKSLIDRRVKAEEQATVKAVMEDLLRDQLAPGTRRVLWFGTPAEFEALIHKTIQDRARRQG